MQPWTAKRGGAAPPGTLEPARATPASPARSGGRLMGRPARRRTGGGGGCGGAAVA